MKAKKWRYISAVLLAIILMVCLSGCTLGMDKIAVINLSGTIAGTSQQGLLTTAGISPDQVRDFLDMARSDFTVKAVVLRIDSPGGSAAASQEIASDIQRFQEDTGKPVVVSMGDIAASGGYYISSYADKIVANPGTLTGSIGVISQFIYIEGLLEKLGMEMETVKSGEYKDMGIRPLNDDERKIMQDITDDIYDQFISAVADGRNLPVSTVKTLATGQLYTGSQAIDLGLVDALGGLDRAIELAASEAGVDAYLIEEYSRPVSFFESMFGGITQFTSLPFSTDELLFLRMLEGWQGMPRY